MAGIKIVDIVENRYRFSIYVSLPANSLKMYHVFLKRRPPKNLLDQFGVILHSDQILSLFRQELRDSGLIAQN